MRASALIRQTDQPAPWPRAARPSCGRPLGALVVRGVFPRTTVHIPE